MSTRQCCTNNFLEHSEKSSVLAKGHSFSFCSIRKIKKILQSIRRYGICIIRKVVRNERFPVQWCKKEVPAMTAVIYARYSSDNQREESLMARFVNVRHMPRKMASPLSNTTLTVLFLPRRTTQNSICCDMQFAVVANESNMRIAIVSEENEKSEPFSKRKQVRIFLVWWARVDSNHRSWKAADLQSVPIGHSGTRPDSIFGIRQAGRLV